MNKELIYDVGMNNGDDTAYYLQRGFRVLAIEADPTLCTAASARFREAIERGRLTVLNLGIAAAAATLEFWICETISAWNSFDRSIASRDGSPHHSIAVPCQTFGWVLRTYGVPFYLKVDIEGNDRLCLDGLEGPDLPSYVSIEVGDLDDIVARLEALGYSGYKLISQFNFLPLQMPPAAEVLRLERWERLLRSETLFARVVRKAYGRGRIVRALSRSRRQGTWGFPEGSSGPFGEETPGRWLSAAEVRDTYHHYRRLFEERQSSQFWGERNYSFWIDLHARRGGRTLAATQEPRRQGS